MDLGWQHLDESQRELIRRGVLDGQAHGGPFHIELDWCDRCNARCLFCITGHLHRQDMIPWDRAHQLLEGALPAGLRSLRLAGGGEPLAHPNIRDLLDWMAVRGIHLDNLTSNGIALDKLIDRFAALSLTHAYISVNECRAAEYAALMRLPEAVFGRVCEGFRALASQEREKGSQAVVEAQFLLHRENARRFGDMLALGCDLGATVIHLRELYYGVAPELRLAADDLAYLQANLPNALADCPEGVRVLLTGTQPGYLALLDDPALRRRCDERPDWLWSQPGIFHCFMPWHSMAVLGNEDVYPCCLLMPDRQFKPLDNLAGKTIDQVWRGESYRLFRRQMSEYILSGAAPAPPCRLHPVCVSPQTCVLKYKLCDLDFYAGMDRALKDFRRRAAPSVWRSLWRRIVRRPDAEKR